jgi:hypothetical protein
LGRTTVGNGYGPLQDKIVGEKHERFVVLGIEDRFPGIHVTPPSALMRKNGTSGENISNR